MAADGEPQGDLDAAYQQLPGDPAGGRDFARAVLAARGDVIDAVGCRTDADREAAGDALVDEVLHLIGGTSGYDPAKLALRPYLRMVVGRKLLNAQRGAGRRRRNEAAGLRLVGHAGEIGGRVAGDGPVGNGLAEAEFEGVRLDEVGAALGGRDRRFLLAVRSGATTATAPRRRASG